MIEIAVPRRSRGLLPALGVLTATTVLVFTLGCGASVKKVAVGAKDEVRYQGTATEAEAKALGDSLKAQRYLRDEGVSVILTKGPDMTAIAFVVQEGAWNLDDNLLAFEHIVRTAAPAVGGLPIKFQYMDSKMEVKKETVVHPTLKVASDEIAYGGTATEAEAKALAEELKTIGYLQDQGAMVTLSKGSGGTVVGFVLRDGVWNDESIVAKFEEVGHTIAPSVGGAPLKIRLLNNILKKQKEIAIS